jgi:hypothetical protein
MILSPIWAYLHTYWDFNTESCTASSKCWKFSRLLVTNVPFSMRYTNTETHANFLYFFVNYFLIYTQACWKPFSIPLIIMLSRVVHPPHNISNVTAKARSLYSVFMYSSQNHTIPSYSLKKHFSVKFWTQCQILIKTALAQLAIGIEYERMIGECRTDGRCEK